MARAKTTTAASKAAPVEVLSDKEVVTNKFKSAKCLPVKSGFCIFDKADKGSPVHAGLAKNKDDAWKLAAHAVL